jgi:hypothetical protein
MLGEPPWHKQRSGMTGMRCKRWSATNQATAGGALQSASARGTTSWALPGDATRT